MARELTKKQSLYRFASQVKTRGQSLYNRLKLKYTVPFLLLLLYTVLGATVFYFTERTFDMSRREKMERDYQYAYEQIMERLVEIKWEYWRSEEENTEIVKNKTESAVDWFCRYLNITEFLEERTGRSPWNWWGSMFYAGTLYTTIGYGRPATATAIGRTFSCFYALIGIPLFLVILKEVGKHLSRLLRKAWKRWTVTWLWQRSRRKREPKNQLPFQQLKESSIEVDSSGEEQQDQKQKKTKQKQPFPITLSFALLIAWILFAAGLFCIWETEWGYSTAIYFVFISLSTIGLGDIVPSKPDLMLANFLLVLIGLALISMVFNIIQIRIEEIMDKMLQQFMDEYEKITAATKEKHNFEFGKFGGGLTAVRQLKSAAVPDKKFSRAATWFMQTIRHHGGTRKKPDFEFGRRRRKSPSVSSDSEDESNLGEIMSSWAANQSSLKRDHP